MSIFEDILVFFPPRSACISNVKLFAGMKLIVDTMQNPLDPFQALFPSELKYGLHLPQRTMAIVFHYVTHFPLWLSP